MTHIENIPHILKSGITHLSSINSNPNYIPIGDNAIISRRSVFYLPNGKQLGDYIPFYLGKCMPMLYVIQKGLTGIKAINAENIIYCVTTLEQILKHKINYLFTDGHATSRFTSFYDEGDINRINDIVDHKAISAKYWKVEDDLDLKRRKEAEFLIENDLPVSAIVGYIVYNADVKNKLISFGVQEKQIAIKQDYYF